jgi:hypothetical protein
MESRFFRIAYAVQFVVTMMAIFEVWGQVGGQGHIDMMPWYAKLLLPGSLSLAAVKATAAAVDRDQFWNKLTTAWLAAALLLITAMGLLTLYEHLHEPADEGDEQVQKQVTSQKSKGKNQKFQALQAVCANHSASAQCWGRNTFDL